ncbi:hypothetical protein LTR08_001021 [Meristemomyces frigidus]|nr:hypothetical protein LTR08_001021 [Meristemomyces frigidus]
MSPTIMEERKAGVKGRRIPGRPGRFDPSMPLHMTTRRRAMHTTTNGTPSVNGSLDDDDSRRSSLDDGRPTTSHSGISQVQGNEVQEPEVADGIVTPGPQVDTAQSAQSSAESNVTRSVSRKLTAMEQSPSPSRKRKRSPSTPPADRGRLFVTPTPSKQHDVLTSDEEDAVEVIDHSHLSDRLVTESSSEPGEHADKANAVAANSIDDTPLASVAVSPASSISVSGDGLMSKLIDDTVGAVMQMDGAEVVDDADEGEEPEGQARSEDEGRPVKRTRGKKRRGPHPNAMIEARMRRQLELKRAYRTITRDQKRLLAEIAQRNLDNLIGNPASCEEAAEYNTVIEGLDAALEKRKTLIKKQQGMHRALLQQRMLGEKEVVRASYLLQVGETQDALMDRLERVILDITRAAQLGTSTERHATEDEDDIVPRPKVMSCRFKRGKALEPEYDSRSRPAMDTELALNDVSKRFAIRNMLQKLDAEEKPATPTTFAVMDGATRDAAMARQQDTLNTKILVDAVNEVERIASMPIIRNEEALGLQLLGDLASRPSITLAAREAVQVKLDRGSNVSQTPPQPFPPPVGQPPMDNHPIEFTASPRAQQIFRERYDASMPPPRTPRDETATFAPSPDLRRPEERAPFQANHAARINGLTSIAAKRPESDQLRRPGPRAPAVTRDNSAESAQRSSSGPNRRNDVGPRQPSEVRPWVEPVQALAGVPDRQARPTNGRRSFDFPREVLTSEEDTGSNQAGDRDASIQRQGFPTPNPTLHYSVREKYSPSTMQSVLPRPPSASFDFTREVLTSGDGTGSKQAGGRDGVTAVSHSETPFAFGGARGNEPYDRSTSSGAIDQRTQRSDVPVANRPDVQIEAPGSPRSRKSSISIKQEARSEGSQGGDQSRSREQRLSGKIPMKFTKTNKEERGGASRSRYKNKNKQNRQQSVRTPSFSGASQGGATPLLIAQELQDSYQQLWQRRPTQHSALPLPPMLPPQMPPPSFNPRYRESSQQHFPLEHLRREYDNGQPNHQHRNSFPPPQPNPPPHWSQPPQNNMYAPPPVLRPPPPPPGVPPGQYRGHLAFAPPPPPLYQLPPTPLTAHPQPTPGSYGQQYGGPAIAPATPDPRYHPPGCAPAPNRLPAFAQQQRHNEGQRRRTLSDAHQDRRQWNEYQPQPTSRR